MKYKNKDGSPDFRYKENREAFLPVGMRKDGKTLDMRFKINRVKEGLAPEINKYDFEIKGLKTKK